MLGFAIVAAIYAAVHMVAASRRLDAWMNQRIDQLASSQLSELISEDNEK